MTDNITPSDLPVRYNGQVPSLAAHDQLIEMFGRYHIFQEEKDENNAALAQALEKDKARYESGLEKALDQYKSGTTSLQRFGAWVGRGFKRYKPELMAQEASVEAELFQNLVDLQDAVSEGYELLSGLPKVIKTMAERYASLKDREEHLIRKVGNLNSLLENSPDLIANYERTLNDLANYGTLSSDEQQELRDRFEGEVPPLNIPKVRDVLFQKCEAELGSMNEELLSSQFSLETYQEELELITGDMGRLERQFDGIQQGWRPALRALHQRKARYDQIQIFAPSAHLNLGMNKLRKETTELIARTDSLIKRAESEIETSRLLAEAVEDADREVRATLHQPKLEDRPAEPNSKAIGGKIHA